jgi:hypothetical protein
LKKLQKPSALALPVANRRPSTRAGKGDPNSPKNHPGTKFGHSDYLGGRLEGSPGMQDRPHESKSELYRRRAAQCLELAKTVQTEKVRLTLIEMADTWLRLAEERKDS